jgi:hypothetical protein
MEIASITFEKPTASLTVNHRQDILSLSQEMLYCRLRLFKARESPAPVVCFHGHSCVSLTRLCPFLVSRLLCRRLYINVIGKEVSSIYTLESLKSINTVFDNAHLINQSDVDSVNYRIKLIESSRDDRPCFGDILEYTNKWGEYSPNAHINGYDSEKGQFLVRVVSHVPFVFLDAQEQGVEFWAGGGLKVFVNATELSYIGKREKLFEMFGHSGASGRSGIYFKATVNSWEYKEPDQQHPGYSTKDWAKQLVFTTDKASYGKACSNYGQDIVFRNHDELYRWMKTYKAVEFPGYWHKQLVLFHYRETDKLLSRADWDALSLPLDTREVNGANSIIHVKVAYDDEKHTITAYRFTNTGYLNPRKYSPYERAKGAALIAPAPELTGQ